MVVLSGVFSFRKISGVIFESVLGELPILVYESVKGASTSLKFALLDFSKALKRVDCTVENFADVGRRSREIDTKESGLGVTVREGISRINVGVVVQYVII